MRIVCIGGGPAGLYFGLLMKRRHPDHEVTVIERNRPYDTFGWGVVFSDQTLGNLRAADPKSAAQILDAFNHWDDIEIHFRGRTVRSSGHGFCGIGRKRLLNILQARCEELGVKLVFESQASDDDVRDADLIIASDGLNSAIRQKYAATYQPDIDQRDCRFVWLGTHRLFDAFTFAFEETEWGWFQAHAYRFDEHTSTFIVETPEHVWRAAGLDTMSKEDSIAFCERLFAKYLDGHALMSNAGHLRGSSQWIRFPRVVNREWVHWKPRADGGSTPVVLMGDAAHTAHFSIGSGTKLALEDAIELANSLDAHPDDLRAALEHYTSVRSIDVLRIQNAARNSTEWFEHVDRYASFEPEQFAYSLLTRSQRISHENLRERDAAYLSGYEAWLAAKTGASESARPVPPMFTPFTLRGITLKNRVVVSPMAQYSAFDGVPGDYHLMHLGARAMGGAALVMTEMTCVSPHARITPACPGLYTREQQDAWRRIVDFVHAQSDAKIGLQIGHSGAKGSTRVAWEGIDQPLDDGNWPLVSASPQQYLRGVSQWSHEATEAELREIEAQFVRSTQMAAEAGFDWLELHCAHGYLLSSFLSPLTNQRTDQYGGSFENRLRYPLQVFAAIRAVWPQDRPISVRISAHDWVEGGNTPDDAVEIARAFKAAGADLIDVSSGQVSKDEKPVYGRMFQTPFADRIRNEVHIPTIAVGAISEADHVNSIIAAGRADLCAIARPHLANPSWTLNEAARIGYLDVAWPPQYRSAKTQLERNIERERAQASAAAGLSPLERAQRAEGTV
ncbi:bifunctional salicylyl-CoA 5-hydroxylase/oxidoreductase [Paraburkholderia caballeronis]|uniref:Anthraniloyl-CoA monooxygenase n=1 Tax=Paraburkholderia caballeronis TaxID=416943 RepID=A0A1H7P4R8_9BURK|nr:bifunctional salicylyl-CoA 5-hydroxylase/oxidoreductase [Paraburkholderia caballeronis]PXW25402.1 anthraniloyl-CoA monooxygenase [Paraburkholderia caballeronis]PXX01009.1 anthraniloyl-CoA monooxygenase [Paraburkholderia caballeronis]RAJ99638.1 anthraniloyl-CoA monooxygenase [Paraburkholderia caballeronis]SEE38879.1 anthraniloyl-CoA monooxygenase [Paraburkholderia caballeronis]SEL30265.1 anthraniloyl-CoA monooxygenase [Paraburkholderia caballeronis]